MTDPLVQLAIMWAGVFFASLLASKTKFTAYTLMFAIFWLNVAVPVTLTLWKPRYEKAANISARGVAS